ncbi:MAG: Crp/Fnr family transcriptional regulator [Butyrivibrio sp.]|nr:Crp/Fnr family transcriptional regulator [Butyrivibrio sp.]
MNLFFLSNTPLFHGISEEHIEELLKRVKATEKAYNKNEIILHAGSTTNEIGLLLSGSANLIVNFYWGNSHIFSHVETGTVFAEIFAAIPGKELICDVVAAEPCSVLFMNMDQMLNTYENSSPYHQRMVQNLVRICAAKSLELSVRMLHTAPHSLRARLLSYLSEQAMINSNSHFKIPFNRQQLADYLAVDRSALSNELSKMQKDGLITINKNEFTLCQMPK